MTRELGLLFYRGACTTNFCTSFRTLNFAADLLNFTPFFFETFVATFVHFNFPTKRNRWWTISQNGWNSASNMEFSQMWGGRRLSNENILRQITRSSAALCPRKYLLTTLFHCLFGLHCSFEGFSTNKWLLKLLPGWSYAQRAAPFWHAYLLY